MTQPVTATRMATAATVRIHRSPIAAHPVGRVDLGVARWDAEFLQNGTQRTVALERDLQRVHMVPAEHDVAETVQQLYGVADTLLQHGLQVGGRVLGVLGERERVRSDPRRPGD